MIPVNDATDFKSLIEFEREFIKTFNAPTLDNMRKLRSYTPPGYTFLGYLLEVNNYLDMYSPGHAITRTNIKMLLRAEFVMQRLHRQSGEFCV